ncbi:MAG: hypothetical protein IT372_40925 [Polyangiaceae bacterium]|nr:hypothetical protein [Polyangiaceae bacterium]
MSSAPCASVTAVGMASGLGDGAADALAAIRAGICGFEEIEGYSPLTAPGAALEPLIAAPAGPPPRTAAATVALLAVALQDLVARAGIARRDLAATPVFAAVPAPDRSPRARAIGAGLFPGLARRAGIAVAPGSAILSRGHAGVFVAIQAALSAFARGAGACVVAGIDSWLDVESLSALDAADRLKTPRNPDGLIPGEAAVAILIEPPGRPRRGGLPLCAIGAPGLATEEKPIGCGDPSTGGGLAAAIQAAAGEGTAPLSWALGDLNGEMYRAAEWGRARVRAAAQLQGPARLWHPADCLGDVGAATGGVLLAVAARALEKGYAPADRAVLFAGADDGLRASLVVTNS